MNNEQWKPCFMQHSNGQRWGREKVTGRRRGRRAGHQRLMDSGARRIRQPKASHGAYSAVRGQAGRAQAPDPRKSTRSRLRCG